MHIKLKKVPFLKVLNHQSSVINRRSTVPVLSHAIMKVSNGLCEIVGTDLDICLCETISCEVLADGVCTFPVHMLNEVVKRLNDEDVIEIKLVGSKIEMSSGHSNFVFDVLSVNDFPIDYDTLKRSVIDSDTSITFDIKREDLLSLINRTYFCMCLEENRYALNGIYFHFRDERLFAVATDGHRLGICDIDVKVCDRSIKGVIIHRKSIAEIKKILSESAVDQVRFTISGSQVMFAFDNIVFISKIIDALFPDYTKVIPKIDENMKIVEVKTKEFALSIAKIASVSDEKTKVIEMHFQKSNLINLSYKDSTASAADVMSAVSSEISSDIKVGFNARFISDALANSPQDSSIKIRINESSPNSAAIFQSFDNALIIIMPVRLVS